MSIVSSLDDVLSEPIDGYTRLPRHAPVTNKAVWLESLVMLSCTIGARPYYMPEKVV
ncbi:hypothetical protein GCM10007862_35540 [Dyella lipolytica]|uniref:Uncharacterized protein n=1 Tax=Dyella lipolytica TaxID=1867835 RepID=A0ABW8IXB8_9GAMM|nr:hypothetical protein [Dyella lipolytica]GLQ48503.1 hypothetical protein GCM10007862_35540 [Dyella lipolytica]